MPDGEIYADTYTFGTIPCSGTTSLKYYFHEDTFGATVNNTTSLRENTKRYQLNRDANLLDKYAIQKKSMRLVLDCFKNPVYFGLARSSVSSSLLPFFPSSLLHPTTYGYPL